MSELMVWIGERNDKLKVSIDRIGLSECDPWFLDKNDGTIRNKSNSFFQIRGIRQYEDGIKKIEQPIIIQDEIGFLGIITCRIGDTWHYLMQAKIEPGNVNVVQISPTLQATKSNFTGKHGGRIPEYLEYFMNMQPKDIIVDQIQSEQSSRFLKKRNRNVILRVNEVLKEDAAHRWMTLRQIKDLMQQDNLVNMDTRTVLSCIPYVLMGQDSDVPFKNKSYFYKTAWSMNRRTIAELYHGINDHKMLKDTKTELVRLDGLERWGFKDKEFVCDEAYPFKVIFCDIAIEGREVSHWRQPLFASNGKATFGLLCCDDNGVMKFLVKLRPEPGCFDSIEIGPTVQKEYTDKSPSDCVEEFFFNKLSEGGGDVIIDRILSEEGGRFYQEENRNVIILVDKEALSELPDGYTWSDYGTLNILTQINNCLNIQLRNLLSLLEV
ncbi:MAG: NDP-hexose 2,3-dehydratase family protein [Lachnospiraceae bacterium]|nr:NDP-hexose 2,3-dehydratase family protein [Lachnospiraceae bacterium]